MTSSHSIAALPNTTHHALLRARVINASALLPHVRVMGNRAFLRAWAARRVGAAAPVAVRAG